MIYKKNSFKLRRDYRDTTQELATLNLELASKMILLASQTGDVDPLIQAVNALRAADESYSAEVTPIENAKVRQALADTLLAHGRKQGNVEIIEHAVNVYRDAITLASMFGDQEMRNKLKKNYKTAKEIMALKGRPSVIRGVA